MKALTMTLVAALTLMSAVSQAELIKLPCGKLYNDQTVRRDNTNTIFTPGHISGRTASASSTNDVFRTK